MYLCDNVVSPDVFPRLFSLTLGATWFSSLVERRRQSHRMYKTNRRICQNVLVDEISLVVHERTNSLKCLRSVSLFWSTSEKIVLFVHETIEWERRTIYSSNAQQLKHRVKQSYVNYDVCIIPTRRDELPPYSARPWFLGLSFSQSCVETGNNDHCIIIEEEIFFNLRRLDTLILWQCSLRKIQMVNSISRA